MGKKICFAVCALCFVAFAGLRVAVFTATTETRLVADSHDYLRMVPFPVWSKGFWAGEKPPILPLFYKLLRSDPERIITVQFVVSLLCWTALATAVAVSLRPMWLRALAFAGVLTVGLSERVIIWDSSLYSESMALSLFVLFVAIWLWLFREWRFYKAALLVVVTFLWVFIRDSNAWMALGSGCILCVTGVFASKRWRYLALGSIFIVFFVGSEISADIGQRWLFCFFSIAGKRILPSEETTKVFAQYGMPVNSALMQRSGTYASSDEYAFYNDPELKEFRAWTYSHGKQTYVKFLLSRPLWTATQPLVNMSELICPKIDHYGPAGFEPVLEPVRVQAFRFWGIRQLMTADQLKVGVCIALFLLIAGMAYRRDKRALLAATAIIMTYPHMIVVWHGDSMSVDRHTATLVIQLRLGLLLAAFLAAELASRKIPVWSAALDRLLGVNRVGKGMVYIGSALGGSAIAREVILSHSMEDMGAVSWLAFFLGVVALFAGWRKLQGKAPDQNEDAS